PSEASASLASWRIRGSSSTMSTLGDDATPRSYHLPNGIIRRASPAPGGPAAGEATSGKGGARPARPGGSSRGPGASRGPGIPSAAPAGAAVVIAAREHDRAQYGDGDDEHQEERPAHAGEEAAHRLEAGRRAPLLGRVI